MNSQEDISNYIPINGDTVALTPPVPSPRKTMDITNPAILMESFVTYGREVTKSAKHPQILRLYNQLALISIWGIRGTDEKLRHNVL